MAASPLPPFPGTGPAGPASPRTLLGQPEPSGAQQVIVKVEALLQQVQEIANQYPESAQAATQVKAGMISMVQAVVAAERGEEGPPAPQLLG